MSLLPILLAIAVGLLLFLIIKGFRERQYAMLALSLGVVVAIAGILVVAYQVQIGYDHHHMTIILRRTSDAIRAGRAEDIQAAYNGFLRDRATHGMSFWEARNRLYSELGRVSTNAQIIQP
jgi:hypothetical protein